MGILILEYYCRAIWDRRERMFERGLLMQREMKEVGGRMYGAGMQSGGVAILGSCNYRSMIIHHFPLTDKDSRSDNTQFGKRAWKYDLSPSWLIYCFVL